MSNLATSPIAVVGASARLPGAESLDAFWELLEKGQDAISEVRPERWAQSDFYQADQSAPGKTYSSKGGFLSGVDEFDAPFFEVEGGEARKMDPQQRLALQEAWRTFEDAGYAPDGVRGKNIGVFVGARTGDYHDSILGRPEELEPQALMGHDTSILSARISHFLDLRGPNLTVNTACSSMGVALHLAVQSLRAGEVDMALVGGVHIMSTAQRFLMHSRSRLLSKSGQCRPFDEDADGFVLGEAVGFVLLKKRENAVADRDRIYGNILATGVNHDGYCEKGIGAPNPAAQVGLIRKVLEKGSVSPETIGYVETHGTGTYKGDAIEANALREAYTGAKEENERPPERARCPIGSVKANIGHALTAAVLPGLLKILLSFKHGKLARQAHFATANKLMRMEDGPFRIQTETADWKMASGRPRRAALSAFSYTGTNFHMILEEEPRRVASRESPGPCLIPLSGKTRACLREQVRQLEEWLSGHRAEASLQDVACTLATGRTHFAFREAFVARDVNECLALLRACQEQGDSQDPEDNGPAEGAQRRADELLAGMSKEEKGSKTWCAYLRDLPGPYKQGAAIGWDALFDASSRRISLPGYPFAKHRYWLDGGKEAKPAGAVKTNRIGNGDANGGKKADLTLFFSRRDDVYQHFRAAKKNRPGDREDSVVQVKFGDRGFRQLGPLIYQIDPRQEEDYERLLEALGPLDGKRIQVVHLWSYECESLDFVYHGNIDRCLHLFQRSLDSGGRSLSLLRRALSRSGGCSSLAALYLHHGVQPQNGLASGWLEDEFAEDPKVRFTSLRLPDRTAQAADLAAMVCREVERDLPLSNAELRYDHVRAEPPSPTPPQESSAGRLAIDKDGVYLIDVGNDPSGLLLVEEWARGGAGKLVVLVDPVRLAEGRSKVGRDVVWLPAGLSGSEDLKRLDRELNRAGISEIHGVVRLVKTSDRTHFQKNIVETLLLDEFTKDSPLDFFLLLSMDAPARASAASRFANGFLELRQQMSLGGQRRGKSGLKRLRLSATAPTRPEVTDAFHTSFEVSSVSKPAAAEPVRAASLSAPILETRFKRIMSEALKLGDGELDLSASLDSLNFDSMRIVEVIDRIYHVFGTQLRPSLFYKHKTLRGVLDEWLKLSAPANLPGAAPAVFAIRARESVEGRVADSGDPRPEPIAIVGMSGRFPMARDLQEFWENLRDGRDCISEIPRDRWDWRQTQGGSSADEESVVRWGGFIDDIDKFDPQFFGISAREAEVMDPQQRLFLQCAWQAIEDAGYDPAALAGTPTGVFVGVATCDYALILEEAGQGREAHSPIGLFHSMLANRVSYLLDLRGPSQPIDTACSSSLVAVHRAVQAIRSGQCSQAIVGGVNALLTAPLFAAFSKAGMLSEEGRCKAFDENANGYVRGEGVGALFLKSLKQARADGDPIYALIRSSAENHGGHASSLTAPSPEAQSEVLMRAYREAGIDPKTVGYVEAHGTGTALGDPIEVDGLKQTFETLSGGSGGAGRVGYCGIGSVKTNIGHLEAAAGIAGLIKVVLAIRNRTLPGNLHFRKLNPYVELEGSPFFVVDKTQAWEAFENGEGGSLPRRAGVSSFGFGGVNAHVVIEEQIDAEPREASFPGGDYPIVLSAKTEERLRECAEQLLRFLELKRTDVSARSGQVTLRNVAYTLQIGRAAMEERLGLLVNSLEALEAALRGFLEGGDVAGLRRGRAGRNDETLAMFADDETLREAVGKWMRQGKWSRLLELWVKGLTVDWRGLYPDERPSQIHLPTYPFARERYWADRAAPRGAMPKTAEGKSEGHDPGGGHGRRTCLLGKQWEPCVLQPLQRDKKREKGAVLILATRDTEDLAKRLLRRFPESAVLDLESPGSSPARRWKAYAGCIDLVGCGNEKSDSLAWLRWVQQFVEQAGDQEPLLLGVTRGLESFRNPTLNLSGALPAGLYRMLSSEYPSVRSRHLDADPRADDGTLVEQIAAEFFSGGGEAEVCYRRGERYRACLREIPFEAEGEQQAVAFPRGHVLWVTGGTGGLGSLCAAHLVRRSGVRKLVLTGREALPPREEWSGWERRSGSVAKKIRAVQALEAEGVEVRVFSVDLTDASALRRRLNEVREDLGPIGGVLHCAGVVDNENPAFIRKPLAGVRNVLAPKVAGTDVLLETFRDEPLAFMVFFSSVSAIVPGLAAGLSDYAMANAYLDYVAEANGHAFPILSIQWPSWKETGMGEVKNAAYAQSGFLSQTNAEGLRFFDRILAQKAGPVRMPVVYDPERWAPEALMRHRTRKAVASPVSPLPAPSEAFASHLARARAWLAELFARELRMDPARLKADIPFQDYGMDSILLAQVWKQINRNLGARLDPSAVFEYPTLEALAAWLVATQGDSFVAAWSSQSIEAAGSFLGGAAPGPVSPSTRNARERRLTDIAVVGASCHFPGAHSLDAYWRLLSEGRTAITRVPEERWENPEGFVAGLLENITDFDPDYFHLPEEDARAMDPQALLVLEESLQLFHHAGYTPGEIKGGSIGVYLGGRTQHSPQAADLLEARHPVLAVGQNYLAANISRFFDLRGPSLVVDTACSSALVGMNLAFQALRSGDIDSAVVGAVSLLTSDAAHRLFRQRKLLSPGAFFHLFDQRASGVVLGEGVGMVLLKTVEQAKADGDRIYAVVKGLAINNDGRTAGPATPNIQAQKAVMQAALERSGLRPAEVDYIEANGSGSEVTDLLELKAIEAVYREDRRTPCLLGSVKPNIGHPLCAEGIAGFIKLVLMLERRQQPPFLSGEMAMTHYDLRASGFSFRREAGPWQGSPRRAALNCFADGGTNAHVILEAWEGEDGHSGRRAPIAPPALNRRNLRETARSPWPATIHSEHPFLKNHAAYGQGLLPGLAYPDLLYQFFRDKGYSLAELELWNLSIHQPLTARPGHGIRLEIQCDEQGDGTWRLRVEGSEHPNNGSPGIKTLYVTAEMRRCTPIGFEETVDLDAIRSASEATPLGEAYAHFQQKGLVHTGAMKAEGAIYAADEARTIELSLPREAQSGAAAFLFHPTLIDGAAVGAGPWLADLVEGEDRLFLPLYCGKFRASKPIRERCVARVRKASLRRKNEVLYSDMEFFDEAGVKIAELTDFAYKLVRQAGLIQAGSSREQSVDSPAVQSSMVTGVNGSSAGPSDFAPGAAAQLLQTVMASKLKRPAREVDLNLGYYELGLDSAMLLDVVMALGKKLSLSLSPTLLFEYATLAELAAHLEETYPAELARLPAAHDVEERPGSRFVVLDFPANGSASLPGFDRKKAETLVAELLHCRLALWADSGNLKVRAVAEQLTPALRETIRKNRDVIASFLGKRKLLPLSRSQRRYWVLSSLQPDKSAYNNPIGMRLRGDVDVERIKEAFLVLMNNHHVLRSSCPRLGKSPVMVIAPPLTDAPCEVIGLTETEAEIREQTLRELAVRESQKPINPAVGPNVRVVIVPAAPDDVTILLTAHHTVFDGYSYLPVMSEFMRIYRALGNKETPDIEGLTQYENYTLREKPTPDRAGGQFWKDHLAGAPACVALPLDRERAAVDAGHGDTRSIWIDAEAYRSINKTIEERRVTLFAFMLSILKVGIAGWAQQTDLVFGTTVQCRDEEDDKEVIGDFTNFIPIRSRLEEKESFAQLLRKVHRTSLLCLQHKNFPFDEIVSMSAPGPRNINPVYNILVNQLPSITEMEERLSDERLRVSVSNNRLLNKSAMLDLRFEWYEESGGLRLICEYNTDLFRDETIEAFLRRLEACLEARGYAGDPTVGDMLPSFRAAPVLKVEEPATVAAFNEEKGSASGDAEALVMQNILELKEIPRLENMKDVSFFELGLGSFDVANLSAELEMFYPEFVVGDIFKHPTIRALSAYLSESFPSPPLPGRNGAGAADCLINFDLFRT